MRMQQEVHLNATREVWQRQYGRSLTGEDAREITDNVLGFFRLLQEWRRRDKADGPAGEVPPDGRRLGAGGLPT